ncbi:MAG: TRAP transporter substrate-binding protein [Alphaproteobacteria bacterium]|nr:TRAP transporter substrate-binding protein [Alphaproteobacteria bacterium]
MKLMLGIAAAVALIAGSAGAQTKWDLPAGYPAGNFHSKNLVQFADDVKAATQGKLQITVHPGASLFKVPEIKRAVQTGQAQIGELLMVVLENEDPYFGIDNVPFLATSFAESKKLWSVTRAGVEKRLNAQGMSVLYAVAWPPQGFYSPKPLEKIEDLRGLKFRSYGASADRFGELSGMQVTTIQAAELGQAFATGRVNSMISSGATGYDTKLWEFVKHFYDVQAWLPKNMIIVNQAAWSGLDAATKDAVTKAAAAAETRGWAESERLTNFYLDEFRKNGMTAVAPSPTLKDGFKKIGEELAKDWLKRAGPDGQAAVDAFRKG